MRVLALDTALGACSVAIVDKGAVCARRWEARTRGHAEVLMALLGEAEVEAGYRARDCDRLAVTVGPGTFTGLRVGLAAARGLALATGLPLLGISTLEALAANASETAGRIGAVLDARRGEVYAQGFEAGSLAPLDEPRVLSHEAALAWIRNEVTQSEMRLVGTGGPVLAAIAPDIAPLVSAALDQPDAAAVARRAAARQNVEAAPATPLYLRDPDAKLPSRNPLLAE